MATPPSLIAKSHKTKRAPQLLPMSQLDGQNLTITFPNGQAFKLPLVEVSKHRTAFFEKEDPDEDWWRHEKPGVLALWPLSEMSWPEVFPHLTPSPRIDRYFDNKWSGKDVDIKLYR
jgi:hypothetical protein